MALAYDDWALVPDDFESGIPEVILEAPAASREANVTTRHRRQDVPWRAGTTGTFGASWPARRATRP
jgi:hypothetical protein